MEKLNQKHQNFIKTANNLEKSLISFSSDKVQLDESLKEDIATIIIKKFEMSFEAGWKFLKIYLAEKFLLNLKGPKEVFRECLNLEIFDNQAVNNFLYMQDIRNATVHVYYDSEEIGALVETIKSYLPTLKKIADTSL